MKTRLLFCLTILLSLCAFKPQAAIKWKGGVSADWSDPANWNTGAVPTATDDVNIGNAIVTYAPTVNAAYTCASITISANVTITLSAALIVTGDLSVGGNVLKFQGSGSATINGSTTVGAGTINLLASSATLIFNGAVTIGTQFTNNNNVFFNNNVSLNSAATLTNKGKIVSGLASAIAINANSVLANNAAGTFVANSSVFTFGNNGTITNNGSFSAYTSTFSLAGTNSNITNSGNYRDHGCTYTIPGKQAFIENSGFDNVMHLSGSTITLSTALGVNGQYIQINNGTFTADSASNIVMSTKNGAVNIAASGTFNAGASGSSCVITLSGQGTGIDNTGTFNLGSTSAIYPSGISSYIQNTSPGIFTLKSDAAGSAAIGSLYIDPAPAKSASCIGNFNVERFMHGNNDILYRNYHFYSSPVYTSNQTVGGINFNSYDLKYLSTTNPTYPITTGIGGTPNGFDGPGNATIYVYREDRAPNNSVFSGGNYIGVSKITGTQLSYDPNNNNTTLGYLPVGNGFAFFYRGSKAELLGRTTVPIAPAYYPNDITVTQTGALNQGNVPVNLWYNTTTPNSIQNTLSVTGTNPIGMQGTNLVGNPYASAIDWNTYYNNTGIITTNVSSSYYAYNFLTHQYEPYQNIGPGIGVTVSDELTNNIPSGMGFFVVAIAPGAQITFTEAAKSTASPNQNLHLMGTPRVDHSVHQMLRLKLFIDSLNYDNILIAFNSNSSDKYNNMEDSQYLAGINAAEGLASFSSDPVPVPLSINFLPLPKKAGQVIRLKVTATNSGRLTLKKMQLDALPKIYELWLMDNYKKDSLDLRNNADYAFDINKADTASYGNNRFKLIVRQNKALGIHLLDFTAVKSTEGVPVSWKTENEEDYTNFTVERSTDNGITFDVLGGFASNAQGVYTFTDKSPVNTVDIYRLKMEDLNGDITYSKAIAIVYDPSKVVAATTKVNVYPNPASGMVNVAITQQGFITNSSGVQSVNHATALASQSPSYGIKIISVTGSVIKTATSATPSWQDNVSGLLPGTYFIQVVNNSDNSVVGKSSFVKL